MFKEIINEAKEKCLEYYLSKVEKSAATKYDFRRGFEFGVKETILKVIEVIDDMELAAFLRQLIHSDYLSDRQTNRIGKETGDFLRKKFNVKEVEG